MCEKMEELKPTPRGLNLEDGWEQQVNGKAERTDYRLEMEKKYWAEEEKRRRTIKKANRILWTFCIALLMITAGGIYLGYAGELPLGISVAVEICGAALLFFTIGLLVGRRQRH